MSDNREVRIWLGRIGGDEWWTAVARVEGEEEIVGWGATRSAALIDLASVLSVTLAREDSDGH